MNTKKGLTMKHFLFALCLLAGTAFADTITLPTQVQAPWGPTTVQAAVTGFSADGNYVYGHSRGYICHGHGGRIGGCTYLYYCVDWTWDLGGNVIAEVSAGPNVYGTYSQCPFMTTVNAIYTTSAGYTGYTVDTSSYGYLGYHNYVPRLDTP